MNSQTALLLKIAAEYSLEADVLLKRARTPHDEAQDLVVAELSDAGKEHLLVPSAADAWHRMKAAAFRDGVNFFIVSAFRSVDRQAELIRRKLAAGIPLDRILAVSALPGHSEHHTGRAVDVGAPGSAPLEVEFEDTPAFLWLQNHAGIYDFQLSYPLGNPDGYTYEPWHWCFKENMGMTMPFSIRRIDHVVFRVRDLRRSTEFYRTVLGCEVVRQRDDLGLVHLRVGASMIDLVSVDGQLGFRGGAAPAKEARNVDHLCLRIDPFSESDLVAYLGKHDLAPLGRAEINFGAEGDGLSLYFTDPDGNVIELKGPADTTVASEP